MLRKIGAGIAMFVLAGCVGMSERMTMQTPPTPELRAKIALKARDVLYDPYSVRDAEISSVFPDPPSKTRFLLCVRANAKNLYGAYTGKVSTMVIVNSGVPTNAFVNEVFCRDERIQYYPFPELEANK